MAKVLESMGKNCMDLSNPLLSVSVKMSQSLDILREINQKANIIAFNAAIEGARTRGRLDSFSIVAEQLHTQAIRNGELSEQLDNLVRKLQKVAFYSTTARYYELAEDLIATEERSFLER
ncbi:methyl-accepting chemotaxis protein, partial [Bdellovibrionota bacterium FG-2]